MKKLAGSLSLAVIFAACVAQQQSPNKGDVPGGAEPASHGPGAAGVNSMLPTIPAEPVPLPSTVLATASVGNPTAQLAAVAAFADSVQPGFGAMMSASQVLAMTASTVRAPGLDGVDMSRPLHLIVLDPKRGGGEAVLVVAVANESRLVGSASGGGAHVIVHDGFAAIGTAQSLEQAGPYALSNLAKSQVPPHAHVVVHVRHIVDAYGAEMQARMQDDMGDQPAAQQAVMRGVLDSITNIERLEGSLQIVAGSLELSGGLFAKEGSGLAQWFSSQGPSDFEALRRLPAGPWLAVLGGQLKIGPLGTFLAAVTSSTSPAFGEVVTALGADMAFAVHGTDHFERAAVIAQLQDGKALSKFFSTTLKSLWTQPLPIDEYLAKLKLAAFRTGKTSLNRVTVEAAPTASDSAKKYFADHWGKEGIHAYFGVVGTYLVLVADDAKGAKSLVTKLAAAATTKEPSGEVGLTAQLADARARKESGVAVFDLAALGKGAEKGAEVVMGLGFSGSTMRTRVTVPPATGKFFVQMAMSQAGF